MLRSFKSSKNLFAINLGSDSRTKTSLIILDTGNRPVSCRMYLNVNNTLVEIHTMTDTMRDICYHHNNQKHQKKNLAIAVGLQVRAIQPLLTLMYEPSIRISECCALIFMETWIITCPFSYRPTSITVTAHEKSWQAVCLCNRWKFGYVVKKVLKVRYGPFFKKGSSRQHLYLHPTIGLSDHSAGTTAQHQWHVTCVCVAARDFNCCNLRNVRHIMRSNNMNNAYKAVSRPDQWAL